MKELNEMTDKQLKEVYVKGKKWMINNGMRVKGRFYNKELWRAGLKRMERIEIELQRRNVEYG